MTIPNGEYMVLCDWVEQWAQRFSPKSGPAVLYDAFAAAWDKEYQRRLQNANPLDKELMQLRQNELKEHAWMIVKERYD